MHDLDLDVVGIEEEGGVVARQVVALARLAVELANPGDARTPRPGRRRPVRRLEGQVVEADLVAVDGRRAPLAQPQRTIEVDPDEIADPLALLALLVATPTHPSGPSSPR
jgi:hypothetical protein